MMTSEKESWTAGREALREVTTHSDSADRNEDALNRYLAGATSAESHRRADKVDAEATQHTGAE
jgi:hypothetical protein